MLDKPGELDGQPETVGGVGLHNMRRSDEDFALRLVFDGDLAIDLALVEERHESQDHLALYEDSAHPGKDEDPLALDVDRAFQEDRALHEGFAAAVDEGLLAYDWLDDAPAELDEGRLEFHEDSELDEHLLAVAEQLDALHEDLLAGVEQLDHALHEDLLAVVEALPVDGDLPASDCLEFPEDSVARPESQEDHLALYEDSAHPANDEDRLPLDVDRAFHEDSAAALDEGLLAHEEQPESQEDQLALHADSAHPANEQDLLALQDRQGRQSNGSSAQAALHPALDDHPHLAPCAQGKRTRGNS